MQTRMARHEINWTSLRRFALFFPLCLWLVSHVADRIPVVSFFHTSTVSRFIDADTGEGVLRLRVDGIKLRDCVLQIDSQAGDVRTPSIPWTESHFDWYREKRKGRTRAAGLERQNFGIWEWRIDKDDMAYGIELEAISKVRATVLHRCGETLTITTMGGFKVTEIALGTEELLNEQ